MDHHNITISYRKLTKLVFAMCVCVCDRVKQSNNNNAGRGGRGGVNNPFNGNKTQRPTGLVSFCGN